MSNFNFDKRKQLREGDDCPTAIVPGGAYYNSAPGTVGGVGSPFQTTLNTIGIGNPVPAGLGNQFGSGDRFDKTLAIKARAKKKK